MGLAHHAFRYFAFFCLVLVLTIVFGIRALERWIQSGRSGLDGYVLALYCFSIAGFLQLLLKTNRAFLGSGAWYTSLSIAEAVLPAAYLVLGAYGFVPRARRWQAVLATSALLVLTLLILAVLADSLSKGPL